MPASLRGTRALVAGLGRSGEAAARFLHLHGAKVSVTDAKPEGSLDAALVSKLRWMEIDLHLGRQEPGLFLDRDLIVVSPGVPWDLPPLVEARSRGTRVIGEVELAASYLQGPVIGVTGSNGKTTTTVLIGHLLKEAGLLAQVGGNVGLPYPPVTDLVKTSSPAMWNVLELSSFQLESICTFHAHIAVVLNVTPDHLDRHHSFEQYAAAKARIFLTQTAGDFAVLNAEDPTCAAFAAQTKATTTWFSRTQPVPHGTFVSDGCIVFTEGGGRTALGAVSAIPIRGAHNLENTLAAAAAARLAGAPAEAIGAAIPKFRAVEHRLEFVRRARGVDYYNDSKATNVDAAVKALESFEGNLWVILGGKDKDSDYTVLRDLLRRKARGVLLVGAAAEKIAAQVGGAAPLVRSVTIENAVAYASEHAAAGDTVLLAPACASFDQFENYEHRGRVFKKLVEALEAE